MTRRVIDVCDRPMSIRLRGGLIVLRSRDLVPEEVTVPVDEIGGITLAHPACTISTRALAALGRAGVTVVVCDERRMPGGMMLPLREHGLVASRMQAQAALTRPTRKRLWRQVVRAKIRNQASVLERIHGSDFGLRRLAVDVKSGDRTNVEATAAARYWRAVFGDPAFLRDPGLGGRNAFLNYGYSVLRSAITRSICGCGLHPALGIQHHNRSNLSCLADDLIEPLRPMADMAVAGFGLGDDPLTDLTADSKRELVARLLVRYQIRGESRALWDIAEREVRSFAGVVDGGSMRLWVPTLGP